MALDIAIRCIIANGLSMLFGEIFRERKCVGKLLHQESFRVHFNIQGEMNTNRRETIFLAITCNASGDSATYTGREQLART